MGNDTMIESSNILEEVDNSTQWLSDNAKHVTINLPSIDQFIQDLQQDDYKSKSSAVNFPLNFSDHQQEINFWFILDLINIGSGFRKELHDASNRGAYETICYGLFGMFLSQSGNLSAKFLSNMSLHEVSSYFGIPVSVEVQQQVGIYTYKDSSLKPLAIHIHQILRESARILGELGYNDFGAMVLKVTDPARPDSAANSAALLVQRLVSTFPAFADRHTCGGQTIHIYKKAQLLCADLYRRFKVDLPERFAFKDIDSLTVFSDNVLPAVLRKYGILTLSTELAEWVDAGKELPPGEQEVELRAVAVHACRLIVNRAHSIDANHFIGNQVTLDYFLWTKGKDNGFRQAERHYTKQTIFY
ncbi:hypothetical protein SAMD00019534_116590, partial [Acytostelium subglobosum LB1]|uniref:hypothetical protein n=1 Tax=Acytostelium subglobosum LB1 TaxID=1410327 RepID=UPI000644A77A